MHLTAAQAVYIRADREYATTAFDAPEFYDRHHRATVTRATLSPLEVAGCDLLMDTFRTLNTCAARMTSGRRWERHRPA